MPRNASGVLFCTGRILAHGCVQPAPVNPWLHLTTRATTRRKTQSTGVQVVRAFPAGIFLTVAMLRNVLIAVLAFALCGADSPAALCAARCANAARPGSSSLGAPAYGKEGTAGRDSRESHDGADCAHCPPSSGTTMRRPGECAALSQLQALEQRFLRLESSGRSGSIGRVIPAVTPFLFARNLPLFAFDPRGLSRVSHHAHSQLPDSLPFLSPLRV